MTRNRLSAAGAAVAMTLAGMAHAGEILYQNDFESGPLGPEWSSNSLLVREGAFTRFNGRYTNSASVLTLGAVPPPDGKGSGDDDNGGGGGSQRVVYSLEFDFYAIDSWDGNAESYGPDTFEVRLNGAAIFSETFANTHQGQSFRRPDVGPEHIGFSPAWEDSIYRDITLAFEIPAEAETFRLSFVGIGLQSIYDESWGIDNVTVSYDVVPAPATLSAGGLMLLFGGRRRTR